MVYFVLEWKCLIYFHVYEACFFLMKYVFLFQVCNVLLSA